MVYCQTIRFISKSRSRLDRGILKRKCVQLHVHSSRDPTTPHATEFSNPIFRPNSQIFSVTNGWVSAWWIVNRLVGSSIRNLSSISRSCSTLRYWSSGKCCPPINSFCKSRIGFTVDITTTFSYEIKKKRSEYKVSSFTEKIASYLNIYLPFLSACPPHEIGN